MPTDCIECHPANIEAPAVLLAHESRVQGYDYAVLAGKMALDAQVAPPTAVPCSCP